jgi:hypothetical protein
MNEIKELAARILDTAGTSGLLKIVATAIFKRA